jgi:hypothetical protein
MLFWEVLAASKLDDMRRRWDFDLLLWSPIKILVVFVSKKNSRLNREWL